MVLGIQISYSTPIGLRNGEQRAEPRLYARGVEAVNAGGAEGTGDWLNVLTLERSTGKSHPIVLSACFPALFAFFAVQMPIDKAQNGQI